MTPGHLRRAVAGIAAAAAVLALAACHPGDTGSDPSNPNQVEIVTWATSPSDRTALDHLIEVFGRQHPRIEVIDASVSGEGGASARDAITARLEAGNPPDIVQVSAGAALRGYVADDVLLDITDLAADQRIDAHVRPELLELLRVEGKLYAIPVSVFRVNVLWSNSAKLAAAGVTSQPASLDAWVADLEAVRASGVRYPLALGNGFTQLQLFEAVLLARLGPEAYSALWNDPETSPGPELAGAVVDYERILEFADPADSARDEGATVNDVIFGDGAYVILADYAERKFQSAGWRFGEQYDAQPAPGTDGVFDVAADAFAMPTGAAHDDSARVWLAVSDSKDGQRALSATKGSLPARFDISTFDYPPFQKSEIGSFSIDTLVPSLSQGIAVSRPRVDAIVDALVAFRGNRRAGDLIAALAQAAGGRE